VPFNVLTASGQPVTENYLLIQLKCGKTNRTQILTVFSPTEAVGVCPSGNNLTLIMNTDRQFNWYST